MIWSTNFYIFIYYKFWKEKWWSKIEKRSVILDLVETQYYCSYFLTVLIWLHPVDIRDGLKFRTNGPNEVLFKDSNFESVICHSDIYDCIIIIQIWYIKYLYFERTVSYHIYVLLWFQSKFLFYFVVLWSLTKKIVLLRDFLTNPNFYDVRSELLKFFSSIYRSFRDVAPNVRKTCFCSEACFFDGPVILIFVLVI